MEEIIERKIVEQKEIFNSDIRAFQKIGNKFVEGIIASGEFKAASGGMGVYAQRGGKEFMIRLRILCGILDFKTLKLIKDMANDHSLKSIHLTTRQAIQLHDLQFDEIISIMDKSLENDLYTRGGGGNFPRNVALSPLSGVEKDEAFDVSPYALLVNKYFISRMNTYKLPRKFKVAFSNNSNDTANASIADLGFIAVKNGHKEMFKLYIGGSLGANSGISVQYDDLIEPTDVLLHVEAILSLFVDEGDFENKGKARMRFIIKRLGEEGFLNCYKKHLAKVKETQNHQFELKNDEKKDSKEKDKEIIEQENVIPQKQDGLYTVVLHPKGGLLKTEDLNRIVDFLENISQVQIRLSMEESMYIRNLTAIEAEELLEITVGLRKTTRLSRSICCIGIPTCQIGIQDSQSLLTSILNSFQELGLVKDVLPALHISGCLNSCSRHPVSEIGFHGKKKRVKGQVEDVYTLHIGGKIGQYDTCIAKEYGDLLATEIPKFLVDLAINLEWSNKKFIDYISTEKHEFETMLEKYIV
ncbi:nitrite/sulfite reductase [Alkalibaculum sp. M08DMB]|uniref:Nitrite/sulfite reductase n=1 Tax=Alkalibaculum sporogenes TaxID=2655001 RepID=A0A6A7K8P5_9FIRM|nr:nitrite/sulfite reductase [Alkalibaculum sporogenes]MPW25776.1 nitrite/sulfite reductase [Alkalibaculum sporogenes]